MLSKFYNLQVHSYFSLLKSCLSIDDIINHALDNQQTHVIMVDDNLYGAIHFYLKAKAKYLTPVIGLNFSYADNKYILIAKNNEGYHNLIRLHSLQNLKKLVDITPYTKGIIAIHLEGPQAHAFEQVYPKSACAISPVFTKTANDTKTLKVLKAIGQDILLKDVTGLSPLVWYLSEAEATQMFSASQIAKNAEIIEMCHWTINDKSVKLAKYIAPPNVTSKQLLENFCVNGLKAKFNNSDNISKKYVDRLFYELQVIDQMGYNDYFLIVSDFVNYAKHKNILIGPGRGSAAGSLVAYALNITEVDPIENNLIFERFLNPSRTSLPDIDIDVMDTRRQEVIDYIFDKYHADNTSYIITFQHIKAKMALRDVGRVLGIPLAIVDKVSKSLSPLLEENLLLCKDSESLSDTYKQNEELFVIANSLIGIPRQISTHAAGIIIADKPLYEYIPIQLGIDDWHLSEYPMEYFEDLGLFKIDILGLKNLTIISEVIDLVWKTQGLRIDLKKIDQHDSKLFTEISNANTVGIFQLESPGMRNTLRKIKPTSIEDISIVSALFRPGPQAFINDYAKTKSGELQPQYMNETQKAVLAPTLGFCIYQEQVIELVRAVTGYSAAEADGFRRAISKKKESMMIKMQTAFMSAAIANHYPENEAKKIYEYILAFANYGFNHSHSLAYSYISYQMMYLKYYFPIEFYLVLLKYGDNSKNNLYISEAKKQSIKIYNVSIRHSSVNFDIYNKGIIFGFSDIKGLGGEIAQKLYETRTKYEFTTWEETISIIGRQDGINLKTLEGLIKVGAFDEFNVDRNFLLKNLQEIVSKANIQYENTTKPIFDLVLDNDYEPATEQEKADWEYKLLSFTFSNNQWQEMFNKYQALYQLHDLDLNEMNMDNKNYLIKINNIKLTMTKFGKKMCFVEFSANDVDLSCASFSESIYGNLAPNNYYVCQFKNNANKKIQLTKVVDLVK